MIAAGFREACTFFPTLSVKNDRRKKADPGGSATGGMTPPSPDDWWNGWLSASSCDDPAR
jgi:hypothetical protein